MYSDPKLHYDALSDDASKISNQKIDRLMKSWIIDDQHTNKYAKEKTKFANAARIHATDIGIAYSHWWEGVSPTALCQCTALGKISFLTGPCQSPAE